MKKEIQGYLSELRSVLKMFDLDRIHLLAELFLKAYYNEKCIFVFGNGGSAATASHFACDINKGVSYGHKKRFKVICLNDNIPTIMAYSNDLSYSDIFVEQLKNLLRPKDLVVGFSGSGNSENILKAMEYARGNEAITFGISGSGGGKLSGIANHCLIVKSHDMQKIEDAHLIISHILMQVVSKKIDRKRGFYGK